MNTILPSILDMPETTMPDTPFPLDPADHARADAILAHLKLEAEVFAVVRLRVYDGLSLRDIV